MNEKLGQSSALGGAGHERRKWRREKRDCATFLPLSRRQRSVPTLVPCYITGHHTMTTSEALQQQQLGLVQIVTILNLSVRLGRSPDSEITELCSPIYLQVVEHCDDSSFYHVSPLGIPNIPPLKIVPPFRQITVFTMLKQCCQSISVPESLQCG